MNKNILKIAVGIVLMVVFLYFFGRSVEWKKVPALIADVNVPLFLLLIPLTALHFVTRSVRWHVLIAREKIDVRFRNLVAANIVGFTVSAVFPGRLGELAKPLYLARKEGLRPGFAVGTVVVERIFDLMTNCLLLGLFLLAGPLFSGAWSLDVEAGKRLVFWGTVGVAIAAALLTLTLLLYFFRERALRVVAFLLKPLPEKARMAVLGLLREFIAGLDFFRSPGQLGLYAGALGGRLAGHLSLLLGPLFRLPRPRAVRPRLPLCLPDRHRRLHPHAGHGRRFPLLQQAGHGPRSSAWTPAGPRA